MPTYRRVARRGEAWTVVRSDAPVVRQPAAVEPEPGDAVITVARELPSDLDGLKKDELVALADEHGVDSSGTKAEIAERLRG